MYAKTTPVSAGPWRLAAETCTVLLLGACSGSADNTEEAASAASDVNLCNLLTAEQVEEVLGQAPGEPRAEMSSSGAPICVWPAADESAGQLTAVRMAPRSAGTYEEYVEQARQATGGHFMAHEFEKLEGVGDFAVWAGGEESGVLQVFSGNHMIQIAAGSGNGRTAQENAMMLAERLVAGTS